MFVKPHSAIPSWYGYIYQGQIAIWVFLKEVNNAIDQYLELQSITEITKDTEAELVEKISKRYSLEIEWMEDFSIKLDDKYKSFHQVKASDVKKTLDDSAILDVILKLLENSSFINMSGDVEIVKGLFHVSKFSVNLPEPEAIVTIVSKFKENLIKEYDELIANGHEDIINKLKDTKGRKKQTFKAMCYDKLKEKKINLEVISENALSIFLTEIREDIDSLSLKLEQLNDLDYGIYIPCHSSLESIEDSIIEELICYFNKFSEEKNMISQEIAKKFILPTLSQLLTTHVDARKKDASYKEISFIEIKAAMNRAINEKTDVSYDTYQYKKRVAKSINDFISRKCIDTSGSCESCNKDGNCNLQQFINQYHLMGASQLFRLTTNINIVHDMNSGLEEYPSKPALQQTIFSYLKQSEEIKLDVDRLTVIKNDANYWCTAYNETYSSDEFNRLLEENKFNILDVLFEADVLIGEGENVGKIEFGQGKLINLTAEDIKEVDEEFSKKHFINKDSIISPKSMRMINHKKAMEEFRNA